MFVGISKHIGNGFRIGSYWRVGGCSAPNPQKVYARQLSEEIRRCEETLETLKVRAARLGRQAEAAASHPTPVAIRRNRQTQIALDADTRAFVAYCEHLLSDPRNASIIRGKVRSDWVAVLDNLIVATDAVEDSFAQLEATADAYGW